MALAGLQLLLGPLARFCLRHSLKLQDIMELFKIALIDAAEAEMKSSGHKINVSRLSVMTGIHRPDVVRLFREHSTKDEGNALTRVLGMWQQDSRFLNSSGRPKTLVLDGKDNQFVELVSAVSSDLNPYAILFELERTKLVARTRNGIKLAGEVYNPRGDVQAGFKLLAEDSEDLLCSVEANLLGSELPNHHIKTQYDRIAARFIPEIKVWLLEEGMAFHKRIRNYLSKFDLDLNPKLKMDEPVTRVALGSFSRIEPVKEELKIQRLGSFRR
jgi:hypothetical protein